MIRRTLLSSLLLFACALPARAAPKAAAPAVKDTSGSALLEVWKIARRKRSDAMFISVRGGTNSSGAPACSPKAPFQYGWRYTFYSLKHKEFLMMAECRGSIAGPLVAMREKGASTLTIEGKFIDSDVALRTLGEAKVSLDPAEHKAGGKRPFRLKLYRLEDERFGTHPVVWKIRVGNKVWLVDAVHREIFAPKRYGVSFEVNISTDSEYAASVLALRPKHAKVYTVKTDMDKILQYGRNHYPGSSLMAIEGFVDAWGGTPCTGPGDGWAYYFYYPRSRGFEVVYACNGFIGPGPVKFIPVDLNLHKVISGRFLDSHNIIDSLIIHHPAVMNEGLGRSFTRHGTLLLRNYRASPFTGTDMWKIRLVWRVTLGRTSYRFDAKSAKLLDVQQHK